MPAIRHRFLSAECLSAGKAFILALFLCAAPAALHAQGGQPSDSAAIRAVLFAQQDAWNDGDIARYMAGYWQSDSLLFVGKSGLTSGWDATLKNYKKAYPDKAAMGQLQFTIKRLAVSGDNAFMLGAWALQRKAGDLSGYFTLLWKKLNGHWVIVLDHSS
jgi:ketosteroid isomerase-like protein